MKILVFNTGSSSIKYQLFDMDKKTVLASGLLERIGESISKLKHKKTSTEALVVIIEKLIENHQTGMEEIVRLLTDDETGVIKKTEDVAAIGHRVVHGGESFHEPTLIDDIVIKAIRDNIPLAPLHNPANLTGIETSAALFQGIPQIAVFDTAFHQTMPAHAFRYAIANEYYDNLKVRRYGFHGTSHYYVAKETANYLKKPLEELNIITLHLGNGASMSAIKNGQSVDTTMGMTPLEGLIMGTRSGDIDPAIHFYLAANTDLAFEDIDKLLNKQSGLKGLVGINDMRDIQEKMQAGDSQAKLAVDMYCYRIKKYIGAYYAVLGHLDAIVFTAGIGENSPQIRELSLQGLSELGIALDNKKNNANSEEIVSIETKDSKVKILVVPTNEELEIALQTMAVISS